MGEHFEGQSGAACFARGSVWDWVDAPQRLHRTATVRSERAGADAAASAAVQ